ncbi:MAG TPA: serine hydrolase [Candidatus Baltobacteraceae bacterium]
MLRSVIMFSALFAMASATLAAQTKTTPSVSPLPEVSSVTAQAKAMYAAILHNAVDRTHLSPTLNDAMAPSVVTTIAAQLNAIGTPDWEYVGGVSTANGPIYVYHLTYPGGAALYFNFGASPNSTIFALSITAGRPPGIPAPPPTPDALNATLSNLRSLPGSVSFLVIANGHALESYHADDALAVGSTFKLAVLNALLGEVKHGHRHWADVVYLKPSWKSLPSGVYQTWPDGTALTVQTLATEMISVSDNTAADALADIVGERAIAPFAGRNEPFLTTRDVFILKSSEGTDLRQRYIRGRVGQRRDILDRVARMPLPSLSNLDTDPGLATIEWHYTNRDLCRLMSTVQGLALMSINPGGINTSDWKRVAFKGGSDWGVVSITTWLVSNNGTTYCVSATENDTTAPVSELRFAQLYDALVSQLPH